MDGGVRSEEIRDAGGQQSRTERKGRGNFEWPLRPILRFGDHAFGHRQLGENLARSAEQQLTLLGQDQATGVTVKQWDAETFLECADLTAYGGLAEVERFARVGEGACLGDGVQDPPLIPVHTDCPGNYSPQAACPPL